MKKNTLLALALITLFLFPVIGLAIEPLGEDTLTTPVEIITLIENLTKYIFYGVMAIAVLFIIIAAFYFLTAAGNPDKITIARQMLIYALIGIAVALLAYALPYIVKGILGVGSVTPIE
jgi:hypothetical protein